MKKNDIISMETFNCFYQIAKIIYEKYITWDLRQTPHWKYMITEIQTEEQYEIAVDALFEDGVVTKERILILKCFTKDLCSYHNTSVFWTKFQRLQL